MNQTKAGVNLSANASSEWVVFTGKIPQAIKQKLKVIAAQTGQKQQEIVAEALEQWMAQKNC